MTVKGVYDTLRKIIAIEQVLGPDGQEVAVQTREEEAYLVEASFVAAMAILDQAVELNTTGGN